MSEMLYTGRITGVRFHLAGTESIRAGSSARITSSDPFRNNLPYPGGVYDAHTGTTDHAYPCETCYNKKNACLGHDGHVELNYPVWNPNGVSDGHKWLKLICFECGYPIIAESSFAHFSKNKRLDEASKIARTGNKSCVRCGTPHPLIKKDPTERLSLIAEYYEDKKLDHKEIIYPHIAGGYLSKISDETVTKLGKHVSSHPKNFILNAIRVPPVTIRPDVKKMGGGRSTNDDLTTAIQIMIKKSDSMPTVTPNIIDNKLSRDIFELNNVFYDFVKASGEGAMNSIATRQKGKTGRYRKNLLGKRCHNMARSTIIGSTSIKIDEVGVPLAFARIIQYEEIVQEFNKKQLLQYVQNGHKKYPGASKIIKKNSGVHYDVESKDIELENGDIILRDMIDGDPVNFNRQPSLKVSNISTHKAVVITDPTIKTLVMNVIACVLFNADFDGDQMNLIISAGVATRNEIAELSSVSNWFISHTSASPPLGQVDDSVIGTAELTRSNVVFDKYHAMLLFNNTTVFPSFAEIGKEGITGRDCISKLLVDTPINFTRTPEWYKPSMAPYMNYDPDEIKVRIERGKLISGILDKKSIGKNASGGIYHIIANDYGATKALDIMYNMQQMAVSHIMQAGYTIGIMDLMIPELAKIEIDKIATDIINKSKLITEELHSGEIVPPIGKTIEEFYEERQINILSIFDDFTEPILRAIDPNSNNLFKLIMFGSKGKINDMFNMMSAIGQKLINGERIRQTFGFKRSLVYFPRFDATPESRGYITNSYLGGMKTSEYIFNAMSARFDLITKALSTSITGEQMRKSIKNLESIIVNNYRAAVKNQNIVQFAYGEDFLDPRRIERVKFPTIMISDEEFEKKYHHKDFPKNFEKMTSDRKKYRDIFLKLERTNIKELMTDERHMPIAIGRLIDNILSEYTDQLKEPSKEDLNAMVTAVDLLCESVPYVLINEIQERLKTKVPEYMMSACWLLCALIRSYLHPIALSAMKITPTILKIIVDTIRLKYSQALIEPGTAVGIIAAQSFSEPLTQYMLDAHHRSATGGTSKSGINTVKEILGAKDLDKLKNPSMTIPIVPEHASNLVKVQEIANNIEMMRFKQFVISWHIYFEKYGEPVHSKTKHENEMINEFHMLNPLIRPPTDLVRWCIRFVVNKTNLILKNMSLELIIARLREIFSGTFIVYTPENAKQVIIRVYMKSTMIKGGSNVDDIKIIKDNLLSTVIRGVDGIISTKVAKLILNKINPDGSISRDDSQWGIVTSGTNMRGIVGNKFVDKYRVHTDAIPEVQRLLGIEAARQKVKAEMGALAIADINHRHYMIYADEMSYTGRITSIESSGLKTRESSNVLLRVGASSPMATLEEAAVNSMEDAITGVTAPLIMGSVPSIGTLYNSFCINRDFVKKHVKKPDDILDELF